MDKTTRRAPWLVRRWWFVVLLLVVIACLAYFGWLYPNGPFTGL